MNCKKFEKFLPLYISGELNKKKAKKIKEHLLKCKNCEKSYRLYLKTVEEIKKIAEKDKISDFSEFEWEAFKNKLYEIKKPKPIYIYNLKKAAAIAFILFGILIGGFYFYINYFQKKFEEQGKEIAKISEAIGQSKLKVCFILKETNTKVIWYFDKNFNLGGENEL